MRTLGIDLASQDKDTASCVVHWGKGPAEVERAQVRRSNSDLLAEISEADWTAIDAPFGWPDSFVAAVVGWAKTGSWPASEEAWAPRVKRLRYRATDLFVEANARLPLSVSSDRIAVTAMRCATLLSAMRDDRSPPDRTGADRVVEVYPGASMAVWEFTGLKGYKRSAAENKKVRRQLVAQLVQRTHDWLSIPRAVEDLCIQSDHVLDALLCALTCRAAAQGLTWPADPVPELPGGVELAPGQLEREGWIHIPRDHTTFDQLSG